MLSHRQASHLFLFIGLICMALGVWMFFYYHRALDTFTETTAVVTKVDGLKRGKVRFSASYKVDDAVYVGSFMKRESAGAVLERQEMPIRYDPINPRDSFYETPIGPSLPYTFTLVGLILWFSGGISLIKRRK